MLKPPIEVKFVYDCKFDHYSYQCLSILEEFRGNFSLRNKDSILFIESSDTPALNDRTLWLQGRDTQQNQKIEKRFVPYKRINGFTQMLRDHNRKFKS